MRLEIAYGSRYLPLEVADDNLIGIIRPPVSAAVADGEQLVLAALENPVGTVPLGEIIRRKAARNAVVVVNDLTRPTPNQQMLPPLLAQIEQAGIKAEDITLIIATGIHRPHTEEENRSIFGAEIADRYKIVNHDCDRNLVSLGTLSNGLELEINRTAADADLLVTIGVVGLHYFAGYSGGRKSILPGIASRQAIEANHKMMSDRRACLGNYQDNPVSDLMLEAARRAQVDFILNVVTQSKYDIAYCAAGEVGSAWLEAVRFCERMNTVEIGSRADIVIASCGGYPKDINMYQAQKALDSALLAVKPGGSIILAAECREGLGEDTFQAWIEQSDCPQDIVDRFNHQFELGGHKAYAICRVLDHAQIMLLSDLPADLVGKMYMQPVQSLEEALSLAMERQGQGAGILVLPEATKIAVTVHERKL
ncbi:MAG: nickel-dependent lactate racemase [Syntrophomonadaceae bacterium]